MSVRWGRGKEGWRWQGGWQIALREVGTLLVRSLFFQQFLLLAQASNPLRNLLINYLSFPPLGLLGGQCYFHLSDSHLWPQLEE